MSNLHRFFYVFLLLVLLTACHQDAPDQAGETGRDATTEQPPLPSTPEERLAAVGQGTENTIMKNQLQGFWRSMDLPGNSLDLGDDMKYTLVDGDNKEKGKWGSPADCTYCNLTNSDVCFYFSKDGANVCCTITRLDNDTLQYFVVGASRLWSFVREKK